MGSRVGWEVRRGEMEVPFTWVIRSPGMRVTGRVGGRGGSWVGV